MPLILVFTNLNNISDAITSDPHPSSGLVIHEATIPSAETIELPKGSPGISHGPLARNLVCFIIDIL